MSTLSKTNDARELVETLADLQSTRGKLDVIRGKTLWQLKKDDLYKKAFGEGVDTWEAFVKSPEIGMSPSEANRFLQIYEYFVVKNGVSEEDVSKIPLRTLSYLLPRVKSDTITRDELPEVIHDAQNLTFADLKDKLYDVHDTGVRTYEYLIMRRCIQTRNLSKVHGVPSEHIKQAFPQVTKDE